MLLPVFWWSHPWYTTEALSLLQICQLGCCLSSSGPSIRPRMLRIDSLMAAFFSSNFEKPSTSQANAKRDSSETFNTFRFFSYHSLALASPMVRNSYSSAMFPNCCSRSASTTVWARLWFLWSAQPGGRPSTLHDAFEGLHLPSRRPLTSHFSWIPAGQPVCQSHQLWSTNVPLDGLSAIALKLKPAKEWMVWFTTLLLPLMILQ